MQARTQTFEKVKGGGGGGGANLRVFTKCVCGWGGGANLKNILILRPK